MNVSVSGVSSTGNAAEIPENITYAVSGGTYANGVFTAGSQTGTATITAMYDGKEVGSTTLNVVQPDVISFRSTTITVPYGKTVDLGVSATFGINTVAIKANDLTFKMSNDAAGTISGFNFTACAENAVVTGSGLTATLNADTSVAADR